MDSPIRQHLGQIGEDIRRLKVDFDRFFNGALPMPPEEFRDGISSELRKMRALHMSYAERFLLNSLEARFNSLTELYNRRLRDAEFSDVAPAAAAAARHGGRQDPYAGILFGGQDSREGAEILYDELYGASGREKKTDFGSFLDFLERKAGKIRELTGCSRVRFRVITSNGELSLKAKPVDSQGD